jgi:hypothetical protein
MNKPQNTKNWPELSGNAGIELNKTQMKTKLIRCLIRVCIRYKETLGSS